MKNTIFTGAGVAIITPMLQDGSVDFEGLKKLIDFQVDNGTDAIIICGTQIPSKGHCCYISRGCAGKISQSA